MQLISQKRHRRHANPFTVRGPVEKPNWTDVFGRQAPLAIDIGCGPGLFVCELARAHPEWNVLGIEIRAHLVENVQQMAQDMALTNVHAQIANANFHLKDMLAEKSVAFVSVNFPDPWYKKRHHKRRVVNPVWLQSLVPALQPQAEIHAMTDYLPIAEQMREVFDGCKALQRVFKTDIWPEHSTHGLTSEREQIHMRRQEPIYRMQYRLCDQVLDKHSTSA